MIVAPVGTHCILELRGCDAGPLDDIAFVRTALDEAVRRGQSTLLEMVSHRFEPQGVTALALLAESHLSIHTWPELGYAAVDAFTCGEAAQPEQACQHLVERFNARTHSLRVIQRGGPPATPAGTAPSAHEDADAPAQEPTLCPARN